MTFNHPLTFTPTDERYALSHAYVPEQIPGLMTSISQATPFLIEDYLGFSKDNWVIFVGYPLDSHFDAIRCDGIIKSILDTHPTEYLWFIGPEIPPLLGRSCQNQQSDEYLLLDIARPTIKPALQREVNQAAKKLTVEHARLFTHEHQSLADELMRRETLPPMITELYRSMPAYVAQSKSALVLNARDARGKLSAFFVIELAAEGFDTYLLGCYSKLNYVPHSSDLLFAEMIAHAHKRGKPGINLGLGVNPGIRRFKMKWGGQPYLKYESCECYYGPPRQLSILDSLLGEIL
jgi:hypothetical protein